MGAYYPKPMSPPDEPSWEAMHTSPVAPGLDSDGAPSEGATVLVLGAYGDARNRARVKDHLNRSSDVTAITVEDSAFAKVNPTEGIHVLADVADYVVLVDEGDVDGGTMFELGTLLTNSSTFEKTFVLVESSARERTDSALKAEIYALFERAGRLYTWNDASELRDIAESLPSCEG